MSVLNITFFGHRDSHESITISLEQVLTSLIETYSPIRFYVGTQGNFDALVKRVLTKLSVIYPHIEIITVLAYLPLPSSPAEANSIYPEGLEFVPPRYAIHKRNDWMLQKADIVVTHVISPAGSAAFFKAKSEKSGKHVINIE